MEGSDSTERGQVGRNQDSEPEHTILMSSKPLHRFVQKEPRSLGIVLVLLGCGELLLGANLMDGRRDDPYNLYVPFWLGAEFVLCGSLSIFTGAKPSKKMVTVCLAMYIISIFGLIIAAGYRIDYVVHLVHRPFLSGMFDDDWRLRTTDLLIGIECVLFVLSLCVSVLLIFLSNVARLALKSTHTQVIFQQVQAPPTQPST
ncbi:membrane-spanning 4-domains subfamily A member 4A-like [Synchiropus picturatus]